MGQGQEVIARRHMATAAAEGCWVLLQNAHLGLGYLAEVRRRGWRRVGVGCMGCGGCCCAGYSWYVQMRTQDFYSHELLPARS